MEGLRSQVIKGYDEGKGNRQEPQVTNAQALDPHFPHAVELETSGEGM